MDRREILWRSGRVAHGLLPERLVDKSVDSIGTLTWEEALQRFRSCTDRPLLLDRDRASRIAELHPGLVSELINSADMVAEPAFQFFGYPTVRLPHPIDWNYDPIARFRWPNRASQRIDQRSVRGDVKWIWELNRLQHLPWLAQAWLFTGERRYSQSAFAHLDSWIEQNPPGRGIAWRGAFEAGIRAISVTVALQGFRDSPDLTVERYRRIVTVLAQSASRCWRDRSLYSSANNHLIGEMAGLALVAILLPELRNANDWEQKAIRTLSVEASKQILPDGAGAEQALAYQLFTVELLHLIAVLVRSKGRRVQPINAAIERSAAFLSSVTHGDEPEPRYGDDDGGLALRLGTASVRTLRDHLAVVSSFAGLGLVYEAGQGNLDEVWFAELSRDTSAGEAWSTGSSTKGSFFAPDGGIVVLRGGTRRIVMDVGPLGYLAIAAHGHSDALAVTLSDRGLEVISDPGTGSYYGHPRWRSVMRGTRAHPTVCVDCQDQSVSGGPFLWTRHAQVRVRGVDLEAGVVDAQHDGYGRLPGNVIHRRWLVAPPTASVVLVVDLLAGTGSHSMRVSWPLHPDLDAVRGPDGHTVRRAGADELAVLYAGTAPLTFDEVRGDGESEMGWWSEKLESRVPAWWLGAVCTAKLPVVVATLMFRPQEVRAVNLSVKLSGDDIVASWLDNGFTSQATISVSHAASVKLNFLNR